MQDLEEEEKIFNKRMLFVQPLVIALQSLHLFRLWVSKANPVGNTAMWRQKHPLWPALWSIQATNSHTSVKVIIVFV